MKKKTIKINFKYFGDVFNPEDNFFTNTLRKIYTVEISDNPDYVFYSVYPEKKGGSKDLSKKGDFIKKISSRLYILLRKLYSKVNLFFIKDKAKSPKGNFVKIFFGAEHVRPNMNECDWAFSSYFEEEINHSKHMRIPLYMVCDYQLENFATPNPKKEIDFKKIKREKKKFCNFINSQEIPRRNHFFKMLSEYKRVDSPGRCMNNMSPIGSNNPRKSRFSESWVKEKVDFIKPYKFTIAFENCAKPGYVSEKLTHPMLVNSIPIYFGHKDVKRDFNTKSFINASDFKSMEEVIEYIIKIDKDDKLYEKILREPWYNETKLPEYFSDQRILNRFKEIFG